MAGTRLGVERKEVKAMEAILSDFLFLESWASVSVLALLVLAIGVFLTRNSGSPESMLGSPP